MKFIKNNIKLLVFIIILSSIILFFVGFFKKTKSYSLEYDFNNYHVKEEYNKELSYYQFNISIDNNKYDFAIEHKYTTKRELIEEVIYDDNCMSIKVFDDNTQTICIKDGEYFDSLINKALDDVAIENSNNFQILNGDHDYYIWNGYGLTNMNDHVDYNFLSNESYTNDLYYQYGDYILFADYDQKHSFNKLYIFNHKTKKIEEFDLRVSVSYDSYFMGNIGDDVYLFDCNEKVQYLLDMKKKRIKIASKKEEAVYFDKTKTTINKNKLYYNKLLFKNNKIYQYSLSNNELYYITYGSNQLVKASDIKTNYILYSDGYNAYFINKTNLYKFDHKEGIIKLANYFEWNFDYLNKIFIFSR